MPESVPPELKAGERVEQALRWCAGLLHIADIDEPQRDARLLLGAAMGLSNVDLITRTAERLTKEQAQILHGFLQRRLQHEPVSRILGRRGFFGREFLISPATLDPRPDTETLIEQALEAAEKAQWRQRPIRILDVGTGSGCILITLLAELPMATGLGTDIDPGALDMAKLNAKRFGVAGRVEFNLTCGLQGIGETFDLLVANPPYIPTREIDGLEPDVRLYDPRHALDGGADGVDVFRDIAAGLTRVVPDGLALFEVGAGQAAKVLEILNPQQQFASTIRRDLGGHDRCVAVWTQS